MKTNEKLILTILTIYLDVSLIWILLNQNLNMYDTTFIYIALFTHIVFYMGIYTQKRLILDPCHYLMFILIIFSIFIKNKFLIILLITLIIVVYITWGFFNRCILNTAKQNETNIVYELTGFNSSSLYNTVILILLLKLTNIIQYNKI